jgi:hypothetical protein
MTKKEKYRDVVKTAIVSAFTIATALIWKEIIVETIDFFFPAGDNLFYKFIVGVLVLIISIIAIYLVLSTEDEPEYLIDKLKRSLKRDEVLKKK